MKTNIPYIALSLQKKVLKKGLFRSLAPMRPSFPLRVLPLPYLSVIHSTCCLR